MRRPFLAANWKMNKTIPEALDFMHDFLPSVAPIQDADIAIAPPFTSLFAIAERFVGTNVNLAAQNVFYEEKGAFTGEVSPLMLKDAGCDFVITGHSERRQYFHESDEIVNRKTKLSMKHGLAVICCIGETLAERESGKTFSVLAAQIAASLKGVEPGNLVVAYEPIWAIGTGKTATAAQAQEAQAFIRKELRSLYGERADSLRILYGGSVTPENIDSLMACPDVDGALVGGASLAAGSFEKIVKFTRGITP
jgi:triosephosphate isomerase